MAQGREEVCERNSDSRCEVLVVRSRTQPPSKRQAAASGKGAPRARIVALSSALRKDPFGSSGAPSSRHSATNLCSDGVPTGSVPTRDGCVLWVPLPLCDIVSHRGKRRQAGFSGSPRSSERRAPKLALPDPQSARSRRDSRVQSQTAIISDYKKKQTRSRIRTMSDSESDVDFEGEFGTILLRV